MKSDRDDGIELAPDDARFVERLAASYEPEPLTADERVAFTAALEARLEQRRRATRLLPALAGAMAVAVAAWLVVPRASDSPAPPGSVETLAAAPDFEAELGAGQWGLELLGSDTLLEDEEETAGDPLPEDYLAIASVFLDG
ncbi:MAG: hypothetical protein QNK04_20995 [Myxococcota bacterium]|nr:hypothetical protein [Myxococcota bacterium]